MSKQRRPLPRPLRMRRRPSHFDMRESIGVLVAHRRCRDRAPMAPLSSILSVTEMRLCHANMIR